MPGADKTFKYGLLKGKSFIDIVTEHPVEYFMMKKVKEKSKDMQEFVDWVDFYLNIDPQTMVVTLKVSANKKESCTHQHVHHKGSSARYLRSTCKECGYFWQEEKFPYQGSRDM